MRECVREGGGINGVCPANKRELSRLTGSVNTLGLWGQSATEQAAFLLRIASMVLLKIEK